MSRRPTGWQKARKTGTSSSTSGLYFAHPNSIYSRLSPTEAKKVREEYNAYLREHVALVSGLRKAARS